MHAVSGRESCCPSFLKEALVSPRPCSRIRMLVGSCEEGAGCVSGFAAVAGDLIIRDVMAYEE